MKNDKDKIIERVRKLLAMAQDSSSPNEAAIAAGRARKLMDDHQIALEDISESDGLCEAFSPESLKRYPAWKQNIAVALGSLNDCRVVFSVDARGRKRLKFQGFEMDVEACRQMYLYLVIAVERLAKRYAAACMNSQKVKRSYMNGCSNTITSRLKEIEESRKSTTAGKGLVLAKMGMVEAKFGATKTRKRTHRIKDNDRYRALLQGECDGKTIGLNDQITGTRRGAITSTH